MTDTLHRAEFLAGFVAEAQEHLATARKAAVAADEAGRRGSAAPRPVRELFRALHTIKGLSGMIGVEPIVDLAHEMETVLRAADRAGGRLRRGALDVLVRGIAGLEERVERVARGEPVPPPPLALLEALAALDAPEQGAPLPTTDLPADLAAKLGPAEIEQLAGGQASGRRAVRVEFVPSPERAARGLDISAVRGRVERLGELVKVIPRSAARSEEAPAGLVFVLIALSSASREDLAAAVEAPLSAVEDVRLTRAEPRPEDAPGEAPEGEEPVEIARGPRAFVRVEVARLDEALDGVSALIVSRSRLLRAVDALAAGGADVRALRSILQDHARELRTLRGAVMRARLVRVSDVLERAPLLVRGLAQSSGKAVRLVVEAGDSEVDKAVGERLFPVIVHLLRNAVDHALEAPDARRAAGKPPEGMLRIACAHRGEGQLELTVADDGRGIDAEALARKAGAPAAPATSAELVELMARPGLSTLASATRTSGRGMGMDVVRRVVVGELGGALEVDTARGRGTTFTLRVPLSVTIVDGITLECAGETYVVPSGGVEELVELEAGAIVAGPAPRRAGPRVRVLRWRDEDATYVELREVLGLRAPGEARRAVVVRRDGVPFGFGVDRALGRQEVVIRPLTDPLVERAGIAGSTDLGDGRPTLVLDLAALARELPAAAREGA